MKKQVKKIVTIGLALVMAFAMASCGAKEDAKVYKVAMEPTFPPFDTTNKETGELDGFDVDMMNAIAKDQGFKVEFVNVGFDGLIPGLESGNFDIIASGMWANEERAKVVNFSDTYYDSGLVVAVKEENNSIKSIKDITKDMVLGGQIGTSSADYIKKAEKEGKIKKGKIYNGVDTAVLDLLNGTIDGLINDKPVTQSYMKAKPGKVKIVGEPLNDEKYGIAVAKDNEELLDKINAGLKSIKDSGEFDKLYKKWFE
ncbi:MAG: basic amino acid ABC transporter substrate-binding protein [Anaerovoracaceae bacterium]